MSTWVTVRDGVRNAVKHVWGDLPPEGKSFIYGVAAGFAIGIVLTVLVCAR